MNGGTTYIDCGNTGWGEDDDILLSIFFEMSQ
jgi:hypothetical protein